MHWSINILGHLDLIYLFSLCTTKNKGSFSFFSFTLACYVPLNIQEMWVSNKKCLGWRKFSNKTKVIIINIYIKLYAWAVITIKRNKHLETGHHTNRKYKYKYKSRISNKFKNLNQQRRIQGNPILKSVFCELNELPRTRVMVPLHWLNWAT